jgi:phosphatidylinositol alpha-1,6-mannosyltransferase
LGPLRLLPLALVTTAAALKHRPGLLLAMNPAYGGLTGRLLRSLLGLPYVVYAYGFEFMKYRHNAAALHLLRSIYCRAQRVVAISDFARLRLLELDLPAERVVTLPPGVEVPREPEAAVNVRRIHKLPSAPYVLTVARLIRRKGLTSLARAMTEVLLVRPDLHWVVVGRGPEGETIERLLAEAGIRRRLHLLGRVPDHLMGGLYREASLFALTPLELPGDAEGYGLVYLEAAARGVTSVATTSGGVPEAVLDGATGLLVPPNDHRAAAAAVLELLNNPERRARLAAAARSRARSMDWAAHARRLLEIT